MKRGIQKLGIAGLTIFMLGTVLAGCSDGGGTDAANGQDGASSNGNGENVYKEKYDPPVTISTVWGVPANTQFKNGETIENNVATKWAHDQLGIDVKSLWSVTDVNGAYETKVRLALTSGQEMPDIISTGGQLAQDLIDSGQFQDAGELFDKYASETWKKAVSFDPNIWNAFVRDGKRMGIPRVDFAYNADYLLWIRQDWLDKLGLEGPKTMDDLEKIMDAFKNHNPDGLSPDKVIPLSTGFKTTMNTWMGDPSWIFGAYGTIPQQWNKAQDGSLEYGSVNENMKLGLTKLKEWRDKGYIPKEAALWDENKTAEPAVAGTAGMIAGPYWMSGYPLRDTAKNVKDAVWKPYLLPTGPDGKAGRHGTSILTGVFLINKKMQHPEAFFTYINYLMENMSDPQPGSQYYNGWFKGYDYDIDADGKVLHGADIPGGYMQGFQTYTLYAQAPRIPDAQVKAIEALASGKKAESYLEQSIINDYGPETIDAGEMLTKQNDIAYNNLFTGSSTTTMKTKQDYLNKLELQTLDEIIYGQKSIDSFDRFVNTWKSSGGEQITKEVNDWYKSVQQK